MPRVVGGAATVFPAGRKPRVGRLGRLGGSKWASWKWRGVDTPSFEVAGGRETSRNRHPRR